MPSVVRGLQSGVLVLFTAGVTVEVSLASERVSRRSCQVDWPTAQSAERSCPENNKIHLIWGFKRPDS